MEAIREKQAELYLHGLFPPPPPSLVKVVRPFFESLGFKALPEHIHVILGAALLYQLIFVLSPFFSSLFPSYTNLRRRSKINWDIHVVSMVQSLLICWLAYLALGDPLLKNNRVFGYSPFAADVSALACGYFMWDSYVSLRYMHLFGVGFALHGLASLAVFTYGFRPFLMYYGPAVLFFELSTPFLNIHWFLDKFQMTGSKFQLVNGLVLIVTFFTARVVWGWYLTYCFSVDLRHAMQTRPEECPMWLASVYIIANLFLNCLNLYWFSKMIDSLRRRAEVKNKKDEDHED